MSPRIVALAPVRHVGSDEYAALGKAVDAMLIDNLSRLPGVRVLDREHVYALIAEAGRGGSDLVGGDAAKSAGKLLTAGSLITDWTQSPTHLRLEALLVDVDAGTTIASARAEGLATEFYNLVPGVAEQFANALGQPLDTLPPDARQKIEQPHTKSIKAVLLLGEALDALDRKDVDAARKACKALAQDDEDFPLAKDKCADISAVKPMALAMAAATGAGAAGSTVSTVSEELSEEATEPSSYKKYARLGLLALLIIGGGAGGGYALSQGGGSGDPPNPAPPPVNNPPSLQGVRDLSVQAGDSAAIDMQCFDSDSTATSIQNTSAGPNSSFNQTSGNPASGHYRQSTDADQAGQVFNVSFVCTDSGNPPASDTKTARITVLRPLGTSASPIPTATPTSIATRTPTATPKPSSPASPSPSPRPSPTPSSTPTVSPSPSPRPSPTPSRTPTVSPSPSPRPSPTR